MKSLFDNSLEFYKKIISMMPNHIYWKDINGTYKGGNDEFAISMGFKKGKDLVGKSNKDLVSIESANAIDEIDEKIIQSGKTSTIEEKILMKNNKTHYFLSKKNAYL